MYGGARPAPEPPRPRGAGHGVGARPAGPDARPRARRRLRARREARPGEGRALHPAHRARRDRPHPAGRALLVGATWRRASASSCPATGFATAVAVFGITGVGATRALHVPLLVRGEGLRALRGAERRVRVAARARPRLDPRSCTRTSPRRWSSTRWPRSRSTCSGAGVLHPLGLVPVGRGHDPDPLAALHRDARRLGAAALLPRRHRRRSTARSSPRPPPTPASTPTCAGSWASSTAPTTPGGSSGVAAPRCCWPWCR